MNSKVVLTLKGNDPQRYIFTLPMVCTIGRASDCVVHLGSSKAFENVSRRHCQLDIDPPAVRIRDLGSLNGTFVNGRVIGIRDTETRLDDAPDPDFPDYPLHDGDEIRVGDVVVCVSIAEAEYEPSSDVHDEADALALC